MDDNKNIYIVIERLGKKLDSNQLRQIVLIVDNARTTYLLDGWT